MKAGTAAYITRMLLSVLLSAGIAQSAWAFTPAQVPLSLGGQVEPNIMFLLDDSGSMRWGYMPDNLEPSYLNREFDSNGDFIQYDLQECTGRGAYAGVNTHFCSKSSRNYLTSSHLNKAYFDPNITYLAPIKSDGSRYASASFTAAWVDGYSSTGGVNLSSGFMALMDDFFEPISYECIAGKKDKCKSWKTYQGYSIGTSTGGVPAFYHEFTDGVGCTADPRLDSCYTERMVTAAQQQNFANWFSFYRNRLMAAKAGVSQAFYEQPGDIRVGYGAINQPSKTVDNVNTNTLVRGVRNFAGTGRSDFYAWLFAAKADGSTPLRRALGDSGEYYSRTDSLGPWSSTPGETGGVEYACRQSYTILTTDGYWNGDGASTADAQKNVDSTNGETISGVDGASFLYNPVSPFKDDHSNTLADVAMYYWNRDLHPTLGNRVATSPENPAFWQHMVTFGVGLGVSGSVKAEDAFAAVKSGVPVIAWPEPSSSDSAKIDDLLHASVNGRGGFFSAQDPQAFANALSETLSSIASRVGSNTAAVPNARRFDNETLVYDAFYSSADWSGKLLAKRPTQTSVGITYSQVWDAGSLLTASGRRLFSHTGENATDSGVALTWDSLSSEMRAHFDNNQALFDYLMGAKSNEAPAGLKYRARSTLLGDIVNSTLVIANKQDWGYEGRVPQPGSQSYNAFVASKASRAPTLFVGANDGFLHAFNANNGQELFAYMPNAVLPNVKQLAASDYSHRYFVDGKLRVRDAVLNGQWRSVLLGTLGAGGKSVFALDVTDTSAAGFTASKILWEIKDDADLGFNYSEPLVGRMKDGKWVAIFGNGHGSSNDDSVLFIVDLESGAVNKVRAGTNTGGLSSPSFVYSTDDGHIFVEEVFAGDLNGNLWKFNLKSNGSGADDFEVSLKSGSTPQPLYIAKDSAGKLQPITVKPEIAVHPEDKSYGNIIIFGTGRMYSVGDVSDTSTQTLYGIWDKKAANESSIAFTGRSDLDKRSILFEGTAFNRQVRAVDAPANEIDWGSKRGWLLDLTSPVAGAQGERVIFSPRILLNRLVVQTAIPSGDPCLGGGGGWTLVLDIASGGRLSYTLFDLNQDGKFDEKDRVLVGDVPLDISGIGTSGGMPTGGYDLLDKDRYWLCRGTGVDDCIPAANTLYIIEGRQSWNQLQ